MADKNLHTSAPDDSPQDHDPHVFGMGDAQHHHFNQQKNTKILWGIFSLLFVLVLGVVFILPNYISAPDPSTVAPVVVPVERPTPQGTFSPFEEAQMLREREEAQGVLEQILAMQETLEAMSVESWAAEEYEAALNIATEGDTAYREQDFLGAQESYQRSLLALQELETRSQQVLGTSIDNGFVAIDNELPVRAQEFFNTALLIDPESERAQNGLRRAELLPEVLNLLEQGDQEHAQGNLEQALVFYQEARNVDPEHPRAAQAVTQTNQDILNRDFQNTMSAGFAAIQQGDPEAALESFNQALVLRPDSADVEAAINQAQTMITDRDLNVQLAAAREHVAAEEWQQALDAYNNALAIDPNVVAARQGQETAQVRLNLDNYLRSILNDPLRLAEDQVYQRTITVYNQALELVEENTRLFDQLRTVRGYLDQARVPVTVTLNSDSMTHVTLFRVAELGMFNTESLELIPGNYTAVGVRPGYRDVRREFVVPFNGEAPVVTVICNEPV
ncbi:MAG: hypothetical protein CMP91_01790 [Gammaproteobacteria bacterium]|nr:hypothetical protein [Gammaproteobacteria bacterium]|tara:strand:+ start:31701 stop:33215 length:1515 start_codon:yes stop_codon:yes gene_type:complete